MRIRSVYVTIQDLIVPGPLFVDNSRNYDRAENETKRRRFPNWFANRRNDRSSGEENSKLLVLVNPLHVSITFNDRSLKISVLIIIIIDHLPFYLGSSTAVYEWQLTVSWLLLIPMMVVSTKARQRRRDGNDRPDTSLMKRTPFLDLCWIYICVLLVRSPYHQQQKVGGRRIPLKITYIHHVPSWCWRGRAIFFSKAQKVRKELSTEHHLLLFVRFFFIRSDRLDTLINILEHEFALALLLVQNSISHPFQWPLRISNSHPKLLMCLSLV